MGKFRDDSNPPSVNEDEEGIPEKFHGKSRKEIADSYLEAERLAHTKAAEAARLQALSDLNTPQNSGTGVNMPSGNDKPTEQPASAGSGEDFEALWKRDPRGTLAAFGEEIYKRAVSDTMRINETREAVTQYLGQYPHLKKAGELFQSKIQAAWQAGGSKQSLYDVLETARKQTEEAFAGVSIPSTGGNRRLLDGQDSGESRAAAVRKREAADDENDNSLDAYMAERNRRRVA